MATQVKLDLKPMKRLQRGLPSALRKALRPLAKTVAKEVKRDAPKGVYPDPHPGQLRRSIKEKVWAKKNVAYLLAGPVFNPENEAYLYAKFIDDRTRFISGKLTAELETKVRFITAQEIEKHLAK